MTTSVPNLMDVVRPAPPQRSWWWRRGAAAAGIAGLASVWFLTRGSAVARVPMAGLVLDTARVGTLRREVRAPGQLQASRAWLISTATAGRVDAISVRPGAVVTAGTEVMRLSNPDVEMAVLESDRQLAAATASVEALQLQIASSEEERERSLLTWRAELADAQRTHAALQALARQGYSAANEVARSADRVSELAARVRLAAAGTESQAAGQRRRMLLERETVARLRALAEGQRERLRGMRVLATERGVVQELRVEPGQWVTVGEPLARVADAMALQAVLKVPEAQVPELAVGQAVRLESRAADAGGWRVPGKVSRIAPSVTSGTVAVEVALSQTPPAGAARDLAIDGVVEIEQLTGALTIARAGSARPGSEGVVYRVSADGTTARRVAVRFGRASLNRIEVVSGVSPGDVIIVSDLALEGSPDVIGLRR